MAELIVVQSGDQIRRNLIALETVRRQTLSIKSYQVLGLMSNLVIFFRLTALSKPVVT